MEVVNDLFSVNVQRSLGTLSLCQNSIPQGHLKRHVVKAIGEAVGVFYMIPLYIFSYELFLSFYKGKT